jgi:hypothetical protein
MFFISVLLILARPLIPLSHLVIHLWCAVFSKQSVAQACHYAS